MALKAIARVALTKAAADTRTPQRRIKEGLVMPDIMHLFKFAVPREQAYQAIATADGIRIWWTSDADLEAFVRGQGELGEGLGLVGRLLKQTIGFHPASRYERKHNDD
jgi:hypothetical protein